MNQPESHTTLAGDTTAGPPLAHRRWKQWAWTPIPVFLAGMAALWLLNSKAVFEPFYLLPTLNFIFSTTVSIFVAYLAGRSFLSDGAVSVLLLGCGTLIFGLVGQIASIAISFAREVNAGVGIYNIGMFLSGFCHFLSAGSGLMGNPGWIIHNRGLVLNGAYALVTAAVGVVTILVFQGVIPPFFIQDAGPTPLRQSFLGAAILLFGLSGALLIAAGRRTESSFSYWYGLSLGLIATGLLGVLIIKHVGSPLGWTGRAAQYLGGVYMMAAVVIAYQESRNWRIPLEEILQQTRDRFEAIFDQAAVGILITAGDGRIRMVNPGFCRIIGYEAEDLMGRPVDEFIHPEDRAEGNRRTRRMTAEDGSGDVVEKRLIHHDGRQIRVQVTVSAIADANGKFTDFVSVVEDITARKAAEEELLRLNTELEERVANRTAALRRSREQIRRLAHQAATAEERERRRIAEGLHDNVQQLLAACSLTLQNLSPKVSDPAVRQRIETVCAWTSQALNATRSLVFDLSPAVLYEVGLWAALDHLAGLMRRRLGLSVDLIQEGEIDPLPEDLRVFLYGTIRELLFNVHHHADIDAVRVFLAKEEGVITARVTDHGRGFDPEELERMSENDDRNTGIGLSTLRERLSRFGGRLELTSARGEGTDVRISAPVENGCEIGET
jgi:PAS domain S-box-containing protein